MSATDVLRMCFPLLRQQKTLDRNKIESELTMLGVTYTETDIEIAWASAQIHADLSAALQEIDINRDSLLESASAGLKKKSAKAKEPTSLPSSTGSLTTAKNATESQMRDISEYKVIQDGGPSSVASQVNKAIQKGWQPLGSMSIYRGGTALGAPQDKYFQVIVKYK